MQLVLYKVIHITAVNVSF